MSNIVELKLPPILPYPNTSIKSQLPPQEWESCLDLWIDSVEIRLRLSDHLVAKQSPAVQGADFLLSYCSEAVPTRGSTAKDLKLNRLCYLLAKRLLTERDVVIPPITRFELLGGGSKVYSCLKSWKAFLKLLWTSDQTRTKKSIDSAKAALFTAAGPQAQTKWLQQISALTKLLPETSTVTVAGADYLDVLAEIYGVGSQEVTKAVTENIFYSFIALLETKHTSILTDNIYHMKSEADRLRKTNPDTRTILSSLLCTTSFMKHFVSNSEIASRKHSLVDQLSAYRHDALHLHPPPLRSGNKGKQRATEKNGMHMHKAAQVSQVHELFPDLSTTYILKALDFYSENAEDLIAALLEPKSLPPELRDQSMVDADSHGGPGVADLAPHSTPPIMSERKNVFDNDEFDQLKISSAQITRGKREVRLQEQTAGDGHAKSKAAIISALALFDADDDERDDTYDVADVGGAVDNTVDTDARQLPGSEIHEATLFKMWKEMPDLFARDSKTRASNLRQQMKRETGMADEQIEGWAILLNKDRKMQDKLHDKYFSAKAFGGQQKVLESTKWQATTSTENSENESGVETSGDARRIRQEGIRGHKTFGRGRGRGAGNTSGPSGEASTQAARKRKEQGRGRGANNRRDARAKKVGRGMGPLPSS